MSSFECWRSLQWATKAVKADAGLGAEAEDEGTLSNDGDLVQLGVS